MTCFFPNLTKNGQQSKPQEISKKMPVFMGGSPCWNWCLTKFVATKSPVPTTVAAHRFLPLHGRLRQLASPPSHRILQTFQCTAHLNQNFDGCWRNATQKNWKGPKVFLSVTTSSDFYCCFFSSLLSSNLHLKTHRNINNICSHSPKKIQKKPWETFYPILSPPKKIFSRSSGFEKSLKFLFETLYQTRILSPPNDMDVA